jgi:hypothetical protein
MAVFELGEIGLLVDADKICMRMLMPILVPGKERLLILFIASSTSELGIWCLLPWCFIASNRTFSMKLERIFCCCELCSFRKSAKIRLAGFITYFVVLCCSNFMYALETLSLSKSQCTY